MSRVTELRRCYVSPADGSVALRVTERSDGGWVGFDEAAEIIAALEARLAETERKRDGLQLKLDAANNIINADTAQIVTLTQRAVAAEHSLAELTARLDALQRKLDEARGVLTKARDQILASYQTWVADDTEAHPRRGQIPRYDAVLDYLASLQPEGSATPVPGVGERG